MNRMELRLAISKLEKQRVNNFEEYDKKEFEINRLMNLYRELSGV